MDWRRWHWHAREVKFAIWIGFVSPLLSEPAVGTFTVITSYP
jgi:hypothetical protein